MWQRFTFYDVRVVAHYLGVLTTFFSLVLVVPLLTALVFQEWEPATRYALTIGISLIVGTGLRLARVEPGKLNYHQALAVVGFAWLFLALIAAIPLALSGHFGSYLDALFDGVSGLTTTGATIVTDLEHLSNADNMWRFSMHAIGGLGLIVIALSLGLFGASTSGLYSAEGRFEHVLPNIVSTVRLIAGIAVIFIGISTILFTVMCLFSGMDPVRAFLHSLWIAISGFMTAGFTPTSQSLAYYHSYPMELGCIVLMVLGAINFGLFVEVWRGNTKAFFKDLEIRTGLIWVLVAGCVFMFSLSANGMFSDLPALLRRGVFMLFAASTTTGFQVVTGNQLTTVLSSGAFLTLALLMAVGGSANSTSGGMKFERLGMVAKSVVSTVRETLAPDSAKISVTYEHIKRRVLRTDVVRAAMTVATLYVFTYIAGALAGIANGYDAVQAIFESVAVASNGGLSAGIISQDMPVGLEMVYILEMWAGRLEFITLLSLVVKIVASCIPSPAFRGVKE